MWSRLARIPSRRGPRLPCGSESAEELLEALMAELLIQWVCSGACEFAFLTASQLILSPLTWDHMLRTMATPSLLLSTQKHCVSQMAGSGPWARVRVCHFRIWPHNSLKDPPLSLPFPGQQWRPCIEEGVLARWKVPRSVSLCLEEGCLTHVKLSFGKRN